MSQGSHGIFWDQSYAIVVNDDGLNPWQDVYSEYHDVGIGSDDTTLEEAL